MVITNPVSTFYFGIISIFLVRVSKVTTKSGDDGQTGLGDGRRVSKTHIRINAIGSMGMIPQGYRVNHFLNDSDSFYIITDVPNGMKHFERTPLTTSMEGDFDTGNVRYKARERYVFGCSDYRGIFGVEGA